MATVDCVVAAVASVGVTSCTEFDVDVVVTDMADATAAEAKDAFLHICKVGVPMSEADFEKAVSWAAP